MHAPASGHGSLRRRQTRSLEPDVIALTGIERKARRETQDAVVYRVSAEHGRAAGGSIGLAGDLDSQQRRPLLRSEAALRQLRECVFRQPDDVYGGRSGAAEGELDSRLGVGPGSRSGRWQPETKTRTADAATTILIIERTNVGLRPTPRLDRLRAPALSFPPVTRESCG